MPLESILSFFARHIESELGIVYAEHNYFQLQNRLEEIAKLLGIDSLEKLHESAKNGISGAFRQLLLDLATNNETSFFRDPKMFRAVESLVLKPMNEQGRSAAPFLVWSAASSAGQEALSVSMMIREYAAQKKSDIPYSILATDISERVLVRARAAIYSQLEVQRGLPAPYLIKYFKKDEQDRWTAASSLTKEIEYKTQNLKEHFPYSNRFDLVFCRNVLIYQNVESKKEILDRVTDTLKPGGVLVLGSGESLIGLSNDYDLHNVDGAVLYKKKAA